jgi:prolyl-tRNA synthetase
MLQSQLFTKTRKEAPSDEVAKNAKLLIRAGFINKEMAGVYSYLPLGLRVIKNIENIIRDEMNAVGGQEIFMPSLHPKENWEKTGRWNTLDVLYKVVDSFERENALGPTHEEIVVPLVKQFVSSYKNLPFSVYQFQNKFRMEVRAKSGILRGREFIMKDLYSFHKDEEQLKEFYEMMKVVYKRIFEKTGIGNRTYLTFASGGSFSKFSHEFQTLSPTGEDTIYICEGCNIAINKEIIKEQTVCPKCDGDNFKKDTSIEVGNIFELKTKFSDPFSLTYKDEKGEDKPVLMGCYGIGIGRVMGTIAEVLSDDSGLVWPEGVAPFKVHLVELGGDDEKVSVYAKELYTDLQKNGVAVLYDDRKDVRAGEKFADSDLMGMPWRVVISKKTLSEGKLELKERKTGEVKMIEKEELLKF